MCQDHSIPSSTAADTYDPKRMNDWLEEMMGHPAYEALDLMAAERRNLNRRLVKTAISFVAWCAALLLAQTWFGWRETLVLGLATVPVWVWIL